MRLPTASKIDLFRACAGPWYLPLPTEKEPSSAAAEKGKKLHKFAETGASQSVRGKVTKAEEGVANAFGDLPVWSAISGVAERECVVRYRPRDSKCEILGQSTESRPYGDSDSEWIWGTADLVAEIADPRFAGLTGQDGQDNSTDKRAASLLLADLKTGSVDWLKLPWGPYGDLSGAASQLPFLAACFNRVLRYPSAVLAIVSSKAERAYCVVYSAAELDLFLVELSDLVAKPPDRLAVTEHCTFCPVRSTCPLLGG